MPSINSKLMLKSVIVYVFVPHQATNLSSNGSLTREPRENKVRSMATQLLAKFESTPRYTVRNSQVNKKRQALYGGRCLSGCLSSVLTPQVSSCLSFPAFGFSAFSVSTSFLINRLPKLSAKRSSSPPLDATENVHAKVRPLVQPKPPPEIQVVHNSPSNELVSNTSSKIAGNVKLGSPFTWTQTFHALVIDQSSCKKSSHGFLHPFWCCWLNFTSQT